MTKGVKWMVFGLAALLAVVAGYYHIRVSRTPLPQMATKPASGTETQQKTNSAPQSRYFYPISRYTERVKIRRFGQFLTASDMALVPCGAEFTGWHTGDDLEVFPDELNGDVPVYSVTEGTVTSAEYTSGYGGLLIINAKLPRDRPVTIYYGHINLDSLRVRRGDEVKPGQILANLGTACSAQTNGERKHLHFAIHLGTAVDVRGYVLTKSQLSGWVDPSATLRGLGAKEPGDKS